MGNKFSIPPHLEPFLNSKRNIRDLILALLVLIPLKFGLADCGNRSRVIEINQPDLVLARAKPEEILTLDQETHTLRKLNEVELKRLEILDRLSYPNPYEASAKQFLEKGLPTKNVKCVEILNGAMSPERKENFAKGNQIKNSPDPSLIEKAVACTVEGKKGTFLLGLDNGARVVTIDEDITLQKQPPTPQRTWTLPSEQGANRGDL